MFYDKDHLPTRIKAQSAPANHTMRLTAMDLPEGGNAHAFLSH